MKASNYSVRRLMDDVREGRVVLPDFQRSFVWHPDDVKDLLVSVLGDYYVGSMLYMDEPSATAPFALRLVEGVEKVNTEASIDTIVKIWLDGQQRTSSLFYALYAPPIALAGRKSPFLYFLDLKELLDENWAIIPLTNRAANGTTIARNEACYGDQCYRPDFQRRNCGVGSF